jgi:hypothetical protein
MKVSVLHPSERFLFIYNRLGGRGDGSGAAVAVAVACLALEHFPCPLGTW